MSIVDDDGIHIRNVYPTFNNIGTDQNIIFFINEIHDLFFQFMSFHLSVCIAHTKIGTETLNKSGHFSQTLNTIMDEKHLASPFSLKINGLTNKVFLV